MDIVDGVLRVHEFIAFQYVMAFQILVAVPVILLGMFFVMDIWFDSHVSKR